MAISLKDFEVPVVTVHERERSLRMAYEAAKEAAAHAEERFVQSIGRDGQQKAQDEFMAALDRSDFLHGLVARMQ